MASLVPGFAYDVFVSYRHKDNLYDGWVTDFVNNLKKELEATFKDNVSVYFDANPEDGIRDVHNVNKSLEYKLRTLVFIPILSQTYCDPKSFALQHEFLRFNELASADEFGKDVRVKGGNFISRVLPVKIHDVDPEDIDLLESALGSKVRAIDFVYREPGVNRALQPGDSEIHHLGKSSYRNQINKVANTIKEIITALRQSNTSTEGPETTTPPKRHATSPHKSNRKVWYVAVAALVVIVSAAVTMFYIRIGKSTEVAEVVERSIVVLPFLNLSADKEQEYFSDGLSEELLNVLAKNDQLKVISRTSAFSFKGKNMDVREIASRLDVSYVLEGSVRKSGNKLRVTVQLIKALDGTHLWSDTYDRDMSGVFEMQDEITRAVATQLRAKLLDAPTHAPKPSLPEVYDQWLLARHLWSGPTNEHHLEALRVSEAALALDSTDARTWSSIASTLLSLSTSSENSKEAGVLKAQAEQAARKAIQYDDNLGDGHRVYGRILSLNWQWEEARASLHRALERNPGDELVLGHLGNLYSLLGEFEEARKYYERAVPLNPFAATNHEPPAYLLICTGKYQEAREQLVRAIKLASAFPSILLVDLCIIDLLEGNLTLALEHAEKCTEAFWRDYALALVLWRQQRTDEANAKLDFIKKNYPHRAFRIAEIYAYRGDKDNAFKWLNQACDLHETRLNQINISPLLRNIHSDPRFAATLKRMGLGMNVVIH